jgi:anti-sigma factor RsiW
MSPVLAIYGKDHILGYVRGTLEDDEEKQDIESLVESDPRAAKIVRKLSEVDIDDQGTVDDSVRRRLEKLQNIATQADVMV